MKTTYERLRTILVKDYQLVPERVQLDTLLESLGIDSLGVADMLFNAEDEFHINVPNVAVELSTVGDVVAFIDDLIAAQSHDADPHGLVTMPNMLTP